jgi:hypothetical protein
MSYLKGKKMKHYDYDWDLHKDKIILDSELDIDKLEWRSGDMFQVRNVDGRVELVKVDPVVKFVKGYSDGSS